MLLISQFLFQFLFFETFLIFCIIYTSPLVWHFTIVKYFLNGRSIVHMDALTPECEVNAIFCTDLCSQTQSVNIWIYMCKYMFTYISISHTYMK